MPPTPKPCGQSSKGGRTKKRKPMDSHSFPARHLFLVCFEVMFCFFCFFLGGEGGGGKFGFLNFLFSFCVK